MSHIVTGTSAMTSEKYVRAAAARLGLAAPVRKVWDLFSGQTADGLGVMLPGWSYPVVIDTTTGELKYDNYNGRWGKEEELAKFKQNYAAVKHRAIAHERGYQVQETVDSDGSIVLTATIDE